MSEINITMENFESEVIASDIPVLVDFWAIWCGPCMMLAPTIEELASEYAGSLKVGKINVDEQQELAAQFGVSSIPTVVLFKGGQEIDRIVGFLPKDAFVEMIEKHKN